MFCNISFLCISVWCTCSSSILQFFQLSDLFCPKFACDLSIFATCPTTFFHRFSQKVVPTVFFSVSASSNFSWPKPWISSVMLCCSNQVCPPLAVPDNLRHGLTRLSEYMFLRPFIFASQIPSFGFLTARIFCLLLLSCSSLGAGAVLRP